MTPIFLKISFSYKIQVSSLNVNAHEKYRSIDINVSYFKLVTLKYHVIPKHIQ